MAFTFISLVSNTPKTTFLSQTRNVVTFDKAMDRQNHLQKYNDVDLCNMINLSNHPLSKDELDVLALGLSFCPDMKLDKFPIIKDLHLFVRKLMLKTIYHRHENTENGWDVLQSLSKSKCRALMKLLTSEDDPSPFPSTSF